MTDAPQDYADDLNVAAPEPLAPTPQVGIIRRSA